MTVTLDNLSLGTVTGLTPTYVKRFGELQAARSRGSMKQNLGLTVSYELKGVLSGANRFSDLQQLQRALDNGISMTLDSDAVKSVVWLRSVKPAFRPNFIFYSLELEDARFKQVSNCDSTGDWSVDSGGGSLSAVSTPQPMEGNYCLRLSGSISGGTASRMKYNPADKIDLSDVDWVAFWFRLSSISNLSSAYIKLFVNGSNYASYNFSSQVTVKDKWYRLRISKADFSLTGTMNWAEIDYITVDVTKSQTENYHFLVDDLGGCE